MTREEKLLFKQGLKQFCQALIEQRIATNKTLIDNAQQAANSEEKSSAGDKYETARAMGHLDKDMHARQLMENVRELANLQQINVTDICAGVTAGAFVRCSNARFFIAAGIGRQTVNGEVIVFLSPAAPLARVMAGKGVDDGFVFGSNMVVIEEVF